jgi:hypothetical protein
MSTGSEPIVNRRMVPRPGKRRACPSGNSRALASMRLVSVTAIRPLPSISAM